MIEGLHFGLRFDVESFSKGVRAVRQFAIAHGGLPNWPKPLVLDGVDHQDPAYVRGAVIWMGEDHCNPGCYVILEIPLEIQERWNRDMPG